METPAQGDVILDKYTVERKLGRGGMGVVVAVRHRHLGEVHALKFMTGMATPEAKERFWREGRAGAQLRGQHVAHVHDLGNLPNGVPYMVMEYLQGADLKTLLYRDGPFSVDDAIRYLLQACEALAEAHDAGIIHRDIKPSNLFLWERPFGDPCIKVLDFGVSKHRFHDDESLTLTKGFLGSPQYMSPEQIASPKNVDARADVWSLGVVLYELLVGTAPFLAGTIVGVINQVVKDEPKRPRDYRPSLPVSLESVVMRCLQKSPDDRFQHIEDLAAALLKVQEELANPLVQVPEEAPEGPNAEKVAANLALKSAQIVAVSVLDQRDVPTRPLRELAGVRLEANTDEASKVSVDEPAKEGMGTAGLDTTTQKVPPKSELEVDVVITQDEPLEQTQPPLEISSTSSFANELRPKRRRTAPIVVGTGALLAGVAFFVLAFVPQCTVVPAAEPPKRVPDKSIEELPRIAWRPTITDAEPPEIVPLAPEPSTSSSAPPENPKPIKAPPRKPKSPLPLPSSKSAPGPEPKVETPDKPPPPTDKKDPPLESYPRF